MADNSPSLLHGDETETDHEPTTQQRIYRAVLRGDIDRALALTREDYPKVLEKDNSLILFKLRCREFGEMIAQAVGPLQGTPPGVQADAESMQAALVYGRTLRAECASNPRPEVHDLYQRTSVLWAASPEETASYASAVSRAELANELNQVILGAEAACMPYASLSEAEPLLTESLKVEIAENASTHIQSVA